MTRKTPKESQSEKTLSLLDRVVTNAFVLLMILITLGIIWGWYYIFFQSNIELNATESEIPEWEKLVYAIDAINDFLVVSLNFLRDHILHLVSLFLKIVAIIFVSFHLVGEERLNMWDVQIKKSFSYAGFKRLLKKGWAWMQFQKESDNKFFHYISGCFFILLLVLSLWLSIRFRFFSTNWIDSLQANNWFGELLISWFKSPIYYLLHIFDFFIKLVLLVLLFSIFLPIILIYYPAIMVFFIFYRISLFFTKKLRLTSPLLVLGVILLILSEILESVI